MSAAGQTSSNRRGPKLLPLLSLALAAAAWGLTPVGSRYLLQNLSVGEVLGTRFTLAGILAVPLFLYTRAFRWPRAALIRTIGWSILGTIVYQVAIVTSLRWTSASTAGIILGLEPVAILAFESAFLRTLPRRHIVLSVVLGIIGILLVVGGGAGSAPRASLGDLLALGAALAWSLYVVGSKPLAVEFGSAGLTALSTVTGGLGLGLMFGSDTAQAARHASGLDVAVLLAIVLGSSLIGFLAWNWGATHVASSQAGIFLYLVPLFSVAGGALLLGEHLSATALAGAAFIVAALITAHRVPESAIAVEPSA